MNLKGHQQRNNQTANNALSQLQSYLDTHRHKDGYKKVLYRKPATQTEIKQAEKDLGVGLPPSYNGFITRFGSFSLSGNIDNWELLGPLEIAKQTIALRKEFNKNLGDQQSIELVNDFLFFQRYPNQERWGVFAIDSRKTNGEMSTWFFDYEDLGLNDVWDGKFIDFDDYINEFVRKVIDRNE